MPGAGVTGEVLKQWRVARGLTPRQLAVLFREVSEEILPDIETLKRAINKYERGAVYPSEEYLMLYHRVFPALGTIPPPAGIAVYGGPGQPAEPPSALLARLSEVPLPDEVARVAAVAIMSGADPARTWALQEKYRELYRLAGDTAAILATLTGEGSDERRRQAG